MKEIDQLAVAHAQALSESLGPEYAALRDKLMGGLAVHGATFKDSNAEDVQALLHNRLVAQTTKLLPRQNIFIDQTIADDNYIDRSWFESDNELEVQNLLQSVMWVNSSLYAKTRTRNENGTYLHAQYSTVAPFYIVGHSHVKGVLLAPVHIDATDNFAFLNPEVNTVLQQTDENMHGDHKKRYNTEQTYHLAGPSLFTGDNSRRYTRKLNAMMTNRHKELSPETARLVYDNEKRLAKVDSTVPDALSVRIGNRWHLTNIENRISTLQMQHYHVLANLGMLAVQFNVGEQYVNILRETISDIET